MIETDVVVVGGGPAGLAAAVALARTSVRVHVVERESALGGIARHVDHTGYGIREFGRPMTGTRYARAWQRRAEQAIDGLLVAHTVTGWDGDSTARTLTVTGPDGIDTIRAEAVVLATGTRERPRAARLVPGSRPEGLLTTGSMQRLVAGHLAVGTRAVVVGAEHVSFSAVMTLAHGGCRTIALVTTEPRHQTYWPLKLATTGVRRVPVLTRTSVTRIVGRARVESVELVGLDTGEARRLECDTVVFTGDWVPDHEIARRGGLVIDRGTRAPRVDGSLRTSAPGVFAAGNLLHGAETAGVCARSGAWVARSVQSWLDSERAWPSARTVPIQCDPPLRWISPNAVVPGEAALPRRRLLARSTDFARTLDLVVHQGDRELWSGTVRRVVPTMPVHIPAGWLDRVEPGKAVQVTVAGWRGNGETT